MRGCAGRSRASLELPFADADGRSRAPNSGPPARAQAPMPASPSLPYGVRLLRRRAAGRSAIACAPDSRRRCRGRSRSRRAPGAVGVRTNRSLIEARHLLQPAPLRRAPWFALRILLVTECITRPDSEPCLEAATCRVAGFRRATEFFSQTPLLTGGSCEARGVYRSRRPGRRGRASLLSPEQSTTGSRAGSSDVRHCPPGVTSGLQR